MRPYLEIQYNIKRDGDVAQCKGPGSVPSNGHTHTHNNLLSSKFVRRNLINSVSIRNPDSQGTSSHFLSFNSYSGLHISYSVLVCFSLISETFHSALWKSVYFNQIPYNLICSSECFILALLENGPTMRILYLGPLGYY